jgi:hypothetical protein
MFIPFSEVANMSRPEDEFTDEPPRRRRREDDETTDQSRRRDDLDFDDDTDVRLPPPHQLSGLDGTFANTHIVALVIFSLCCGGIALILGIIGLITCKDPRARQNALIVTIISGIFTVLGVLGRIVAELSRH